MENSQVSFERSEDWPRIMRELIAQHMAQPFSWGGSDCAFVFEIVRAMTGRDILVDIRGYTSEAGALKRLNQAGHSNTLSLVQEHFVEIAPEMAQRGDIGYPRTIAHPLMSPAIIDGANAFSKDPSGGIVIPRSGIARAWRV